MREINKSAQPIRRARVPKVANYECVCNNCGQKFLANRRTALYCSVLCRVEAYREKQSKKQQKK